MKQKTRDRIEKNLREGFRKFSSEYASDYLDDVLETDDHELGSSGRTGSTRPTGPVASAGYGTRRRKEK